MLVMLMSGRLLCQKSLSVRPIFCSMKRCKQWFCSRGKPLAGRCRNLNHQSMHAIGKPHGLQQHKHCGCYFFWILGFWLSTSLQIPLGEATRPRVYFHPLIFPLRWRLQSGMLFELTIPFVSHILKDGVTLRAMIYIHVNPPFFIWMSDFSSWGYTFSCLGYWFKTDKLPI